MISDISRKTCTVKIVQINKNIEMWNLIIYNNLTETIKHTTRLERRSSNEEVDTRTNKLNVYIWCTHMDYRHVCHTVYTLNDGIIIIVLSMQICRLCRECNIYECQHAWYLIKLRSQHGFQVIFKVNQVRIMLIRRPLKNILSMIPANYDWSQIECLRACNTAMESVRFAGLQLQNALL